MADSKIALEEELEHIIHSSVDKFQLTINKQKIKEEAVLPELDDSTAVTFNAANARGYLFRTTKRYMANARNIPTHKIREQIRKYETIEQEDKR